MEGSEPQVSFDDFGWLDVAFIRNVLWKDIGKQHRLPEEYRIGLRTWAAAISHAPLVVANRLTLNAPEEVRSRLGSLIVYERPGREESEEAKRLITELYKPDILRHARLAAVREPRATYSSSPKSQLPDLLDLQGLALLDTRGVEAAEQFAGLAEPAYGLVPNLEGLQAVYRRLMDWDSDALRAALGTPRQVGLATGRLHVVRARAADLTDSESGGDALIELSRVLSVGGCLVVEDEPGAVDRVQAQHPSFERRSPSVAVLTTR